MNPSSTKEARKSLFSVWVFCLLGQSKTFLSIEVSQTCGWEMWFLWVWICYWYCVHHLESDPQVCERVDKKGCALPGNTVEGVLCIQVGGIWLVMVIVIVRQQEVSKLQGHLRPVICNTIHSCFQKEIFNVFHHYSPFLPAHCTVRQV